MRWLVRVRPEAELDLLLARSWYEAQRRGLGILFESEILALLRSLEDNALIYARVIDHSRCAYARRFPYVITYEIRGEEIAVVSILHTSRRRGLAEHQ